jgi:preprotein translocase subunit SecY
VEYLRKLQSRVRLQGGLLLAAMATGSVAIENALRHLGVNIGFTSLLIVVSRREILLLR